MQSTMQKTPFELDTFVASITALYERLASYTDYEPTEELVKLYGDITSLCLTEITPATEEQVFNDERIQALLPKLREKWGEAAGVFEEAWARKILAGKTREKAMEILAQYPRLKNYRSTCPLEMGLMTTVLGHTPKKTAMIGCGPLPLTGLTYEEYAKEKGIPLDMLNIDIVADRVKTSDTICSLLGRHEGLSFHTADGRGALPELADCDVVMLASVAGVTDQDKTQMMHNISKHMSSGSLILTRGSNGLSRLLYPRLDLNSLKTGAPDVEPALQATALDGPTKHGVYVLRVH